VTLFARFCSKSLAPGALARPNLRSLETFTGLSACATFVGVDAVRHLVRPIRDRTITCNGNQWRTRCSTRCRPARQR
jgi:hypothetical protein